MKKGLPKNLCIFLFVFYLLLLLRLIVFKGPVSFVEDSLKHYNSGSIRKGYLLANFIPFKTIYYYASLQENITNGLQNIGGNIILLIPFGFFLPLLFPQTNKPRKILLAILMTSLGFELFQLATALGNFDVDDLLLNSIGGMTGYLVFLWLVKDKQSI